MLEIIIISILVLIGITIFLICYYRWCDTHKRPLTDDEICRLSQIRIKKEIKRINNLVGSFESKYTYKKNTAFNPSGDFYSCNIDSYKFPSYIASQLFGKKHEWLVLGLVHEGVVVKYWANKGADKSSVSLHTSMQNIINVCRENNCTALLDLHNHPNSNPNNYNHLIASKADKAVSYNWFQQLNNAGISLYSFVCERGRWLLYHKSLTDKLQKQPLFTTVEYIKKENGLSERQNLKLHKEIGIFHR